MNCQVSQDVIFNMEVFNMNIQLTSNERCSQLSDTLTFFPLFLLIGQQAYLPIWQIKVLHMTH